MTDAANAPISGSQASDDVFVCPAAPNQQALWFLDRLQPGQATYNISHVLELTGSVNWPALQQAVDALVERHESLRTGFALIDDQPCQVIRSHAEVRIRHITVVPRNDADARRLATEEAARPFDLSTPPLMRVTAITIDESTHLLVVVVHHIVSDGWSQTVLFEELAAIYRNAVAGTSDPLPPVPIQYADYCLWQEQRLKPAVVDEQLTYWRRTLADAPDALELPGDNTRPSEPSARGDCRWFTLDADVTERLRAFARAEHASMFMAFAGVLNALVARYTGSDDIIIGTPVASRPRAEVERTVGFFANTIALRTKLGADPTFRQLLGMVRAGCLAAFQNQDVPFPRIVEAVRPDRASPNNPLFSVMCALQRAPEGSLDFGELGTRDVPIHNRTAKFDWLWEFHENSTDIQAALEFSTDRFSVAAADRAVGHFQTLLRSALDAPDTPMSRLALLTEPERRTQQRWNATAVDWARPLTVLSAFDTQVRATPDGTAMQDGDACVSYHELDARATRLSRVLVKRGVRAGDRVGLLMPRSTDLPIALLAILKAGAAYVPLDPTYPPERLRLMAGDAGLRCVVADQDASVLIDNATIPVITPSQYAVEVDTEPSNELPVDIGPAAPCYVMYTSGSTGRPKGVVMPHGALANLVFWQVDRSAPALTTLQFGSPSFDVSFQEIFATWLSGGRLVIVPEAVKRDPKQLLDLIERQRVQRIFLPFVALEVLAEAAMASGRVPDTLQEIITAGEQLRVTPAVRQLFQRVPHCRLDNQYGPTESHVVTAHALIGDPATWPHLPPIGTPVANARIHLLDAALQPVPVGIAGDIWLAGQCLAEGYWQRPDLTTERFRTLQIDGRNERAYQSGDRGRYRADGAIEFLGRGDDQVKIRGFRVEPGEVEAALERIPGVRQVAVVARPHAGETRLIAFYVPAQDATISAATLRTALRDQLPDYLVPSVFVPLDALPTTPSGKIDRRRLPDAVDAALSSSTTDEGTSLTTETERRLAAIWQSVLGLARVGRTDNFFDVGGHSLAALRVFSAIEATCGVSLPLSTLFRAPTLEALARIIETETRQTREAPSIAKRLHPDEPVPATPIQQGLWFLDRLQPGLPTYNMPAAFWLDGSLDRSALQRTMTYLESRHDALRTTFELADGEHLILRCGTAPALNVEYEDLRGVADPIAEAERRATELARTPFDLTRAPLWRVHVLAATTIRHLLVVVMHHAIFDGVSQAVFFEELGTAYAALAAGSTPVLGAVELDFADFAAWHRERLTPARLEQDLAYWREALAGAPESPALPLDHQPAALSSHAGATVEWELDSSFTSAIRHLARTEQATPFMVVIALTNIFLARATGQRDVVIGIPTAGRPSPSVDRTIGFFANVVALRTDLRGSLSLRDAIARVRQSTIDALDHQAVSLQHVVDAIGAHRSASRHPIFQVVCTYQKNADVLLTLKDLDVRETSITSQTAKFDVLFGFFEQSDRIRSAIEYSRDLFDDESVRRWVEQFNVLSASLLASPDAPFSTIEWLPSTDRTLVLAMNETTAPFERTATIAQVFEARAAEHPDRIAATCGTEAISYRDLDRRANRIARFLQHRGIGADVCVGVALDRSIDLLVSLLAILKAGGAYVPLDLEYPQDRIRFMVADTNARLVITTSDEAPAFEGIAETLCLDDRSLDLSTYSDESLPPCSRSEHLAYVMYTSGSTGTPKGVGVTHRGVIRLVRGTTYLPWRQVGAILHLASVSFDASTFEVWGALLNGARSVLVPDRLVELGGIERVVRDGGVDCVWLTAALFNTVVDTRPSLLNNVKWILTGGEALSVPHVRRAQLLLPDAQLINGYGPTETTTFACCHAIPRLVPENATTIPIGRPIENTTAYVLDANGMRVPTGIAGELFIGGDGVANGYLNQPSLTAERFVPDPFSTQPDSRMYRTGDLVRLQEDGTLVFLGRLDRQVKVRGFRIELGEIEIALARHPAVRQCAVIAQESASGQELVAFVEANTGTVSESAVQDHLRSVLPPYMVPGSVFVLERLPLTLNGKIDIRQLTEICRSRRSRSGSSGSAPESDTEKALAAIWESILNRSDVRRTDNFFEIGGHSLAALRVFAAIEASTGVSLPLSMLFRAPTLEALAQLVDEQTRPGATTRWPAVVTIHEAAGPPLVGVHSLSGDVLEYRLIARHLDPNQHVIGLQAPLGPDIDIDTAYGSIEATAERYLAELRQVQPEGPYYLCGWSSGGALALEIAQRLTRSGATVALLAVIDSAPYNVAVPPRPLASRLTKQLANVPFWFWSDVLATPPRVLLGQVRQTWRRTLRRLRRTHDDVTVRDVVNFPARHVRWEQFAERHFQAVRRYVPAPYQGRVSLFSARTQPLTWLNEAEAAWRLLARDVDVYRCPGTHFSIVQEPNVKSLAEAINTAIQKARSTAAAR